MAQDYFTIYNFGEPRQIKTKVFLTYSWQVIENSARTYKGILVQTQPPQLSY